MSWQRVMSVEEVRPGQRVSVSRPNQMQMVMALQLLRRRGGEQEHIRTLVIAYNRKVYYHWLSKPILSVWKLLCALRQRVGLISFEWVVKVIFLAKLLNALSMVFCCVHILLFILSSALSVLWRWNLYIVWTADEWPIDRAVVLIKLQVAQSEVNWSTANGNEKQTLKKSV